jgi:hypothetical protein
MPRKRAYPKLSEMPNWSDAQLDELDLYLSGVIAQAHQGARAGVAARKLFDEQWIANQAQYWQHGRSVLRWLRGQIRRQRQIKRERELYGTAKSGRPDRECGG